MKLFDVCEINPRQQGISDDTLVSFVAMPDVSEDGKIKTNVIRPFSEVKKGYTVFQEGDILFAKITPCMENGKGALATGLKNGIGVGSTEFHVLRPNPGYVDGMWVYYLTAWPTFRREAESHMTGSAGQRRVPKSFLEEYSLSVPSLKTQHEQVEHLNRINKVIEARKEQLCIFDDLIKARFVEIYMSSSLSEETSIEAIVKRVKVGFVGTCEKYYSDNSGVPMLRTGNITANGIDLSDLKYVTSEFHESNLKSQIHAGDILIARHGSNGQANVYNGPTAQCLNAVIIVPNTELASSVYLANLINSPMVRSKIDHTLVGSTQHVVNTKSIAALTVRIPDLMIQHRFENFVSQVDKSKLSIQASLDQLEILKQSLMQKYFGC